jgi:N-acetylneuraminate synthase
MNIDNFLATPGNAYIIAEIGNNHNGSYSLAIEMINKAISAGANCVKFQMRTLDQVYRKRSTARGEDLGTEYVVDLLKRFELTKSEHKKLFEYCSKKNITYLCTPWDSTSLEFLEEIGVSAYKVASADLTNMPLIELLIKTGKPLILSTGMSTLEEIKFTASALDKSRSEFTFLHCNSTYPAPLEDINLSWINELKKIHSNVGYSGHERGTSVTIAAVAMGISIIERHFTLDRNMEGPDHPASLEFHEFTRMVKGVREVEAALGSPSQKRSLSQGEMINRENLAKSLVSARPLKAGIKITAEDIIVKSPGQGISPQHFYNLVGKTLTRDMSAEDFFYLSDISSTKVLPKQYSFKRKWGIPVRFHDFKKYYEISKPELVEFHLSYQDILLNPSDFLDQQYECDFVVHAPELFENSELLDLASPDLAYRDRSIKNMQRVIDLTVELKKYFPSTLAPMIVTNIGGISMDQNFSSDEVQDGYKIFSKSLSLLKVDGVEIIPQTMAPYPWHFGGQRFQNLFVHPEEIIYWCEKLNLRMCFDISHSMLTANNFGYCFYELCEQIAPLTAHLHIGDAEGLNGEGLQIGEGSIDFNKTGILLNSLAPQATFIPEIWQGHKNDGEGFWKALELLEPVL